jgi:hypothetical protein
VSTRRLARAGLVSFSCRSVYVSRSSIESRGKLDFKAIKA